MPHRTYTEEEVAALFQRAAELQVERGRRPASPSSATGLSLDELRAIAADSGLDPELLSHAARELDTPRKSRISKGISGGETYAEYRFPGTLTDELLEDIVAELRHRYDSSAGDSMGMPYYGRGRTETIGRSVEWRQTDPWTGNETRVLIQPRDDGTRVRLSKKNVWGMDASNGQTWAVMIALFAAFFVGPISGSFLIAGIVLAILLFGLPPLFGFFEKRTVEKRQTEFEDLAEMIGSHLNVLPAPHRQMTQPSERARPEIDLDVEAANGTDAVRHDRRTRSR